MLISSRFSGHRPIAGSSGPADLHDIVWSLIIFIIKPPETSRITSKNKLSSLRISPPNACPNTLLIVSAPENMKQYTVSKMFFKFYTIIYILLLAGIMEVDVHNSAQCFQFANIKEFLENLGLL